MRIKGKTITPPDPVIVALPRKDEDIIFTCGPVLDYEEFEALYPAPKPPLVMRPGKANYSDTEDPEFLRAMEIYAERKTDWMILKSLSYTEDLEWDTVDMKDPNTWANYRQEMEAVLTAHEVDLVIQGCFEANFPSENAQKQALERFMSSQVEE